MQEGGQRRGDGGRWSEKTWTESNGLGKGTGPGCWWTVTWREEGERHRKDRSGLWPGWESV